MSLIPLVSPTCLRALDYALGFAHVKQAGDATPTHSLAGRLYASGSGWILLSVPNAIVRGLFDALDEPGIQLPTRDTDDPHAVLNAHVSVMNADEVQGLGGIEKITERGHSFRYQLGPIKTVAPKTWNGVSRVWYCTVLSPELRELRRSYGLSPQPHGDWDFHITVAIRKSGILGTNPLRKAAGNDDDELEDEAYPDEALTAMSAPQPLPAGATPEQVTSANPKPKPVKKQAVEAEPPREEAGPIGAGLSDTSLDIPRELLAAAAADKTPQQIMGTKPAAPPPADMQGPLDAKIAAHRTVLKYLQEAKLKSDQHDYAGKNQILQEVMRKNPAAWKIDTQGRMSGVTHQPTGFKFHMPVGLIVPGVRGRKHS